MVTPGTPSMALSIASPCQCTLLGTGKSFVKATWTRSPAVARNAVPGIVVPYAQVDTTVPPRSISTSLEVSARVRTAPVVA